MQELMTSGTNVGTPIALLVAVASSGLVAWAVWLYVTSAGHIQKVDTAKSCLTGASIGLGIAFLVFIGSQIFSWIW